MSAPPSTSQRVPRLVTAVYAAGTLLALSLTLTSHASGRPGLLELLFQVLNVPVSRSVVSFVLLVLITINLLARRRVGWLAVVVTQVFGVGLGVASALNAASVPLFVPWVARSTFGTVLDVVAAVVGIVALGVLWRVRGAFSARLQPGSWRGAAAALVVGALLAVGAAVLLEWGSGADRWTRVEVLLDRATGLSEAGDRGVGVGIGAVHTVAVLLALAIVAAVVLFLRSARLPTQWSGERELALRSLLSRYGEEDSLGYFATRRDKASVFSADGCAAVTYTVIAGVSLASGDPVGAPASWPGAIAAWKDQARSYGWVPAVLSASERGATAYAASGLRAFSLGDEAILAPDRFDLRRPGLVSVRAAVQRVRRAGVTLDVRLQQDVPATELAEVAAVAEAWRGDEAERGFSMALGRSEDPADGRTLVVTARAAGGGLCGLLTFVPWGRRGASLDLMRRSSDAPNGVTEAMVAEVMARSAALGLTRVSLNFCMFRGVYADATRVGSGPLTRLNYSVLGVLDRFWQLERLYRSNVRLDPTWVPRFLCYEDPLSLPHVALAAGAAEGFLPRFGAPSTDGPGLTSEQLARAADLDALPAADSVHGPRRSDQTRHRLAHLAALRRRGRDPYPVGDGTASDPLGDLPESTNLVVRGRVRGLRRHGGVVFADLADGRDEVQVLLAAESLGREEVDDFARLVDTGDLVRVDGRLGRSRRGSSVVLAHGWAIEAKALHPLPWRAFDDPRARLRRRSTDLIVHPDQVDRLRERAAVVRALRRTLDEAGFLEVETPILQSVHGGASARPFTTRSNAYGADLSLRIAPELFLKRLVVGGVGAVYEIGRNFRNEGADATHNPEFTALEAYLPHADYLAMADLARRLVLAAAQSLGAGGRVTSRGHGEVDLSGAWPVVPVLEAVSAAVGRSVDLTTPTTELVTLARERGVPLRPGLGVGALLEALYAELVEPSTAVPTFYCDFPSETSPLARPHRSVQGLAERWDLVVAGMELATAYSELTDPLDQRARLTEQSIKAAAGDVEAMELDEDFLLALETGMPPTGGLGIGVDRLVMLLTGTSIREVLAFPFVRPVSP